jgi:ubiquinone biosynthesis protein Coq4
MLVEVICMAVRFLCMQKERAIAETIPRSASTGKSVRKLKHQLYDRTLLSDTKKTAVCILSAISVTIIPTMLRRLKMT